MAFCRFSTDSFRCDLYVYAHVDGGYMIHVAANRVPDDTPIALLPLDGSEEEIRRYCDEHNRLMEYLKIATRSPINLPYAGETLTASTPNELVVWLDKLRELGYRFPDHVYEAAYEDMEELPDEESD